MIVHTVDKLETWRDRIDRLALALDDPETSDFLHALMDEVDTLTMQTSVIQAARMFDRYHAFDGIKDDRCPACGGRVRVDESDPARLRIASVPMVSAS